MPAHNAAEYISRAMDSILTQQNERYSYELIVIDDGSTDDTAKIVQSYCSKRVTLIHADHCGPGRAREIGLQNATGEYVLFVDADDYVYPQYFERIDESISDDVDLLEFGYYDEQTERNIVPHRFRKHMSVLFNFMYEPYGYLAAMWSRVIRRRLFEGVGHSNAIYTEDYYVLYQIYRKEPTIKKLDDILYYYCKNSNSITNDYSDESKIKRNAIASLDVGTSLLERFADKRAEKRRLEAYICLTCAGVYSLYDRYGVTDGKAEFVRIFRKHVSLGAFMVSGLIPKMVILIFGLSPKLYSKLSSLINHR